jgi:hypothetical protein
VGAELFHADGQTAEHDKANSHLSQFCDKRKNELKCRASLYLLKYAFIACTSTFFPSQFHFTLNKQDRQCTHKVILRRVHEIMVAAEKQRFLWLCKRVGVSLRVCWCVRVCGFAGTMTSTCVCPRVLLLPSMQNACAILHSHLRPLWLHHILRHYLINGTIFGRKLFNIKRVFWCSLHPLSETFLILRRI